MASRQRTTFQKRQKEMKRQEKRQIKAERRAQRNLAKREGTQPPDETALQPTESELEPQP